MELKGNVAGPTCDCTSLPACLDREADAWRPCVSAEESSLPVSQDVAGQTTSYKVFATAMHVYLLQILACEDQWKARLKTLLCVAGGVPADMWAGLMV